MRRRLERLERSHAPEQPIVYTGLAAEIRAIDENIARLDEEIAELDAAMTPEEVERTNTEHRAFMVSLEGLSLDEKIEALTEDIEALDAQIAEEEENEKAER